MKIINKLILKNFWERYPETEDLLETWLMTVLNEQWDGSADVLACFSKAKLLIDGKVSFPISLRHGCLVISVHYTAKIVNIAAICSLNESSELAKPYPTSTAKGEIYVC